MLGRAKSQLENELTTPFVLSPGRDLDPFLPEAKGSALFPAPSDSAGTLSLASPVSAW